MQNRIIWPLAAIVVLFTACSDQPPPVSLEQAKQITAQFQGQGFTPPPRTISDITAILDQHKPDAAKAAAARTKADAQPAANLDQTELAKFYFDRGIAASEIGRGDQWMSDLGKAVEIARSNKDHMLPQYMGHYGTALWRGGRTKDALDVRGEHIKLIESLGVNTGQLFGSFMFMASGASSLGDIEAANRWVGRGERLLLDARGWQRGGAYMYYGDFYQATVTTAKAGLARNTGRSAEAEQLYRQAIVHWTEADRKLQTVPASMNPPPAGSWAASAPMMQAGLAHALLAQGRVVEAEVEARRSLLAMLKLRGRYATETAESISALTNALQEQGRYEEATKLATANIDIYENIGHGPDSTRLNQARLELARALLSGRREQEALVTFERIARDTANLGPEYRRRYLDGNMTYGIALIRNGRTEEALRVFRDVADRRIRTLGERNYMTAEARGYIGAALARKGDRAAALVAFRAAVPVLLAPSRDVEDEESGSAGKDVRMQFILESYIGALADAQGTSDATGVDVAAESFRLADAIRGRTVQRALAASSARASASDPALADLVRREQDAQKQIASLQGILTNALSAPADQQDGGALHALRTQIDSLRGARAAIRQDIERRFPDYVNLIDPRPATVDQARRNLRPGEALIATYVGRDRSFVWAVPAAGPVAFAAANLGQREMGRQVADLRRALDPNAATLGDIPTFDVGLAHRLYAALLAPVEAGWKSAKSLLVVPHGPLGQLPFTVLVTAPAPLQPDREGQALFASYKSVPFLVRSASVTQLPSVASLGALRALPPARGERHAFIGFGDPLFSADQAAQAARETQAAQLQTRGARTLVAMRGVKLVRRNAPATQTVDSAELAQLPRLPDTADEVRAVAVALNGDPTKDVFIGRDANERRVREMDLSNRKVVMFATHGLVPGDLNGLTQPALALSAPNVADVDGDGLLTLDEVLALKLNADWIVLSACNTATGDGAGAEAVSGLGRAFFYAGTRALLVSNWPVETTSARALTTDLFRRQADNAALSRAEALREAELALIDGSGYLDPDSKATVFSYAHPIFWAPFSLVGDGGG
jgi:CHAT domain-containing protein/tetratricopeptide (TPR) repeat protein